MKSWGDITMNYNGQWTFSTNDEMFNYGEFHESKEEAIEAGKDYFEGSSFYIGQVKDIGSGLVCVDAGEVLEIIGERAYDECGEIAEYYLSDIPEEHQQELEGALNLVLKTWIKKHGYEPTFFGVKNVEKIEGCNV